MPAAASANVTPSVSTQYEYNTPGAHGFYEVTMDFQYTTPEPAAGAEDLKKWIIDSPAGLAGNPNAIPYAERCSQAQFGTSAGAGVFVNSTCPASSKVGEARVTVVLDNGSPGGVLSGDIYILQTTPEVPTTLGTRFFSVDNQNGTGFCGAPPCPLYPKTKSVIAPVTSGPDGDFRLRTIPAEYNTRPTVYPASPAPAAIPAHITKIVQRLYGAAPNGNAFITYPTRCGSTWDTYSYATSYDTPAGTITGLDPNNPGDGYTKAGPNQKSPSANCAEDANYNPQITSTLSTNTRDSNPQVDVVVSNPKVPGYDVPKSIVTTLPASITTDLQNGALQNLCEAANAAAGTCPAASKVGSAVIATPFIAAGLTGDVYAVRGASAIPDLGVEVAGAGNAINFRLKGTSSFVGVRGNQIQTVFDNLPQTPFSKFTLTINGGQDSLLTISKCPADGKTPEDGPITYSTTGYSGQTSSSETATKFGGCYGAPVIKSIKKCIKFNLRVTPTKLVDVSNIAKMELYAGTKKKKVTRRLNKDVKAPFKFDKRLSHKFKKGKRFYFRVKVTYKPTIDEPGGKSIYSKTATAKRCR